MFHVTLTGFPGFAPGRPEVSIVVEDHWSEIAETVERAKFSAISEFPKWSKYLILLSFQDNSSARSVQIGGWM